MGLSRCTGAAHAVVERGIVAVILPWASVGRGSFTEDCKVTIKVDGWGQPWLIIFSIDCTLYIRFIYCQWGLKYSVDGWG